MPAPAPSLDFPRPLTSVDLVIFTARDGCLQVLLVQRPQGPDEPFPGRWALPGGFVNLDQDASLEDCALRKLAEKTGLTAPYLEQLGSWGNRDRDPRGWSATHVYFALLPLAGLQPRKGANAADVAWHPVQGEGVGQELAFDHGPILAAALARLRGKAEYTSLPVYLLPEEFTLPELQQAYEIVLGRPVDKSGFRTRVLAAELVMPIDKQRGGGYRPAQLYRLQAPGELVVFPRTFSPRDK